MPEERSPSSTKSLVGGDSWSAFVSVGSLSTPELRSWIGASVCRVQFTPDSSDCSQRNPEDYGAGAVREDQPFVVIESLKSTVGRFDVCWFSERNHRRRGEQPTRAIGVSFRHVTTGQTFCLLTGII